MILPIVDIINIVLSRWGGPGRASQRQSLEQIALELVRLNHTMERIAIANEASSAEVSRLKEHAVELGGIAPPTT